MTVPLHRLAETNGTLFRYVALILVVLALPLCAVALGTAAGLLPLPYPLWLVEQRLPGLFRMHMVAAGLALLAVPIAIACHGLNLHKLVGRTAATLVLAGGATAVPAALASEAHWMARTGFVVQALAWIALVMAAVRAIRRGDRVRHMWLMLAVAAIASGALWLRLSTWAAVAWGSSFETVYALAAWLSWVVPLGVVASLAYRGRRRQAVAKPHSRCIPAAPARDAVDAQAAGSDTCRQASRNRQFLWPSWSFAERKADDAPKGQDRGCSPVGGTARRCAGARRARVGSGRRSL